jgi:hypothetical protein
VTLRAMDRKAADGPPATYRVLASDEQRDMLRKLSGLRSDPGAKTGLTSVMQEAIWTATFDYGAFAVVYESGFIQVPILDAHIEVYDADNIGFRRIISNSPDQRLFLALVVVYRPRLTRIITFSDLSLSSPPRLSFTTKLKSTIAKRVDRDSSSQP